MPSNPPTDFAAVNIGLQTGLSFRVLIDGMPEGELTLIRLNYYSRLRRVVIHLNDHVSQPISLCDAAQIACMERTSFSRFFRRVAGISFREFLQQWRIAIAVDEMMKSDISLTEIAYSAGFASVSAFERTFKKITSVNPSEYRRRLQAQYWRRPVPTTAD